MVQAMQALRRLCHRQTDVEGELGYFGLGSWWLGAFTRAEQHLIESSFQHPNAPARSRPLTMGHKPLPFHSAAGLLTAMAACLRSEPQNRNLALRILAKAEERARIEDNILGMHFAYQEIIRLHTKWRDHFRDSLDLTFGACHKQVTIAAEAAQILRELRPQESLPTHLGFQQLAILLEREGSYSQAIEVCKQAREQGWSGNWTWRIGCLARRREERDTAVPNISSSGMGQV